MAKLSFTSETAKNYAQKCLCVLVLDLSGSMNEVVDDTNAIPTGKKEIIDGKEYQIVRGGISRIQKLREGLEMFLQEIEEDDSKSQKLEVAIITFNDKVEILQSPALIEDIDTCLLLDAEGNTDLMGAMEVAMDLVEARKSWYRTTNQNYYRPWIVLITDGEPNVGQDMNVLADAIKKEVDAKHFAFIPIGVDNADMQVLSKLSADIPAMPLAGTKFSKFFAWLSASMTAVVGGKNGDSLDLTNGAKDWMSQMGSFKI